MPNEIRISDDALQAIFGGLAGGQAQQLKRLLDEYHRIPLARLWLHDRAVKLRAILAMEIGLKAANGVNASELDSFMTEAKNRLIFFERLMSYTRDATKKTKIKDLIDVFLDRSPQLRRPKPRVELGAQTPAPSHFSAHMSLQGRQIFEKLDPYHRRTQETVIGRRGGAVTYVIIEHRYRQWVQERQELGEDPAESLVDFLLANDTLEGGAARLYHTKEGSASSVLVLDADTGLVYAYYRSRNPEVEDIHLIRCDPRERTDLTTNVLRLPYTNPSFHWPQSQRRLHQSARVLPGEKDLVGADLYVMRKDKLYTYPAEANLTATSHSYVLGGRAVQAAGMILAENGKVVAIDNKSGHYLPPWRTLAEPIRVLEAGKAFSRFAIVGAVYGEGCMYLPLSDFKELSAHSFPVFATVAALERTKELIWGAQAPEKFARYLLMYTSADYRVGDAEGDPWPGMMHKILDGLYAGFSDALFRWAQDYEALGTWTAATFHTETWHLTRRRSADLLNVEHMLTQRDEKLGALRAVLETHGRAEWNVYKLYQRALDVTEATAPALRAASHWVQHHARSSAGRRTAVQTLEQQLLQESRLNQRLRGLLLGTPAQ